MRFSPGAGVDSRLSGHDVIGGRVLTSPLLLYESCRAGVSVFGCREIEMGYHMAMPTSTDNIQGEHNYFPGKEFFYHKNYGR